LEAAIVLAAVTARRLIWQESARSWCAPPSSATPSLGRERRPAGGPTQLDAPGPRAPSQGYSL